MLLLFRRIFQLKNRTLCLKCCKKFFKKSKIWFQYLHFDVWIRHFHSLSDISSHTYECRKSDNPPQFNWEQGREREEVTKNTVREVVLVIYCYCKYSLPFLYKSISSIYYWRILTEFASMLVGPVCVCVCLFVCLCVCGQVWDAITQSVYNISTWLHYYNIVLQ